jgi:hypothetical protein
MAAPFYRYYTADLITGNVLGDISLVDVSASMLLSAPGDFAGSFPVGQPRDQYNMDCTQPGRTALYVERNDELIWGGILWTRHYDSDERRFDLTAQTFDSFYGRTVLEANYVKQAVEQVTCITSLVSKVNAQPSSNIGITCPAITATGVLRTILLPAYEFHYADEVLDQIVTAADGLEYTVEVVKTGTADHPSKTIRLAPIDTLNVVANTGPYLDYPGGSIQKYIWPENAMQGGNTFAGRGAGIGNQAPTALYVDATSLAQGYPALWSVEEYNEIVDKKLVKTKTQRRLVTEKVPLTDPLFDVHGDVMVGWWQKLGATVKFDIRDARFPNGYSSSRRMYGWDMSFEDEDTEESVTITTDNGGTQ